jgi:enoyl-CoA hydratase/carnithine racemase
MTIHSTHQNAVLTLHIDRPDKKNAFDDAMYHLLTDALRRADRDDQTRAVLIRGNQAVFSAGHDLAGFLEEDAADLETSPVFGFLQTVSRFRKPLVASVRGLAIGIGATLLLHCDLVYASEDAHFCMPFAQLGLCPEAAASFILPAMAGYHRAMEILLLGDVFNARRACEWGLVNRVLPDTEVDRFALQTAEKLCGIPLSAALTTKRLIKSHWQEHIEETLHGEARQFAELLQMPDSRTAIQTILDKRGAHHA